MAEGGKEEKESMRNNLCGNEKEKTINQKDMNINMVELGFPETAAQSSLFSFAGIQPWNSDAGVNVYLPPAHVHSQCNTTELKQHLDNGPLLTPTPSEESLQVQRSSGRGSGQSDGSSSSSVQITSIFTSSLSLSSISSNADSANIPPPHSNVDGEDATAEESNIVSSYLRVEAESTPGFSSTDRTASTSDSSLEMPSKKQANRSTNDLNAEKAAGSQSSINSASASCMMFSPNNMMCYPTVPVNFVHANFPSSAAGFMPVYSNSFGGAPAFYFAASPAMMSVPTAAVTPQPMNISCPPTVPQISTLDPHPLTATYNGGGDCQQMTTTQNITACNISGASPSSAEDNSSCSNRSYSLQPGNNTRLVRLRKPVLDWLQKELDMPCYANWENLADERGMNFEDIRAHLEKCKHTKESPFLKLLDTENFHMYTVGEFLKDMDKIKRKDIISEFGKILQRHS